MMKCIIIDDEENSRNYLSDLIHNNHSEELVLIGTADSVENGERLIRSLRPDLIFLDVQMPPKTGFDLLRQTADIDYQVIFCTSYDQYALDAIKFSAIDYLLKPAQDDELAAAVAKVIQQNESLRRETFVQNLVGRSDQRKIVIPFADGFTVLKPEEIVYCQSDRNYCEIYTLNGDRVVSSRTLKHYEQLLTKFGFFRIHQSHLINTAHVRNYYKGKEHRVELTNKIEFVVARAKRDAFIKFFENQM
ncbi:MAG: LytTR family DNA-binding domain-containing protein [Flavobacteriales bacterium]|nr:LytTR family DNA-binding domain-containing protein [Flavobacteriales bacterium]